MDETRSTRRQAARTLMERMMGPAFADRMEAAAGSGAFGAPIAALAMDQAFADVWARPGLPLRDRSLVVIAALAATNHPAELKNHVRFGLNNGLNAGEIEEILIQLIPYLGFPAISVAIVPVLEALRERGLDGAARTASEDGLL